MSDVEPGPEPAAKRPEIQLLAPELAAGVAAAPLERWLAALVAELAPEADSLTVQLTGEDEMRRLNRRYRGRDRATDVLSFPGEATPEGRPLGDLAVAVPVARRQAAAAGDSLERELKRLLLHGVLHCLGHDHETDDGEMERLERRLRRRWIDADA